MGNIASDPLGLFSNGNKSAKYKSKKKTNTLQKRNTIEEKTKELNKKAKYYKAKVAYKHAKKKAIPFGKLPTLEIRIGKKKQGKTIKKSNKRIYLF
jgi:hypothetical protein